MSEPQVWTLIGVFGTAMFAMVTVVSGLFVRVLKAEISGLRGEMRAEISELRGEMRAEIGGLRGEMHSEISGLRGEMNARFETLNRQIQHLDRDVQAVMKRVFGHE
ncbi:MAG: hypothetical protein QM597_07275 [Aeromicrobium sp.]|uniref:hypothetical protein n=1 Tax=Aeromicrobium sp. TaxID=1871063 RepID=UPI0039E6FB3D